MNYAIKALFAFSLTFYFFSCTGLKHVPETEKIFTGSAIKIAKAPGVGKSKKVLSTSNEVLRPKPNSSLLGIRFGLWWYYKTVNDSSRVNKWLFKKLAQEPVYLSNVRPEMVNKALQANLFNHGHFSSESGFEVVEKKKTAAVVYSFQLQKPYMIAQVIYPDQQDELNLELAKTLPSSLLKVGRRYDLNTLVSERMRILEELKDLGFYYLNEDDLLFSADSTPANKQVIIKLRVKEDVAEQSVKRYKIGEVNVNADYQPGTQQTIQKRVVDSVNYYSEINYIRPMPIVRSVFLKNGRTYNRMDHNLTYSRLMGLGVYKYVNIRLTKADSTNEVAALNAQILLMPLPQKSLSAEVQGVSKSNNFIGPGLNFSFRNRNAFQGAELFVFGLRTSFETQLNGPFRGQFTYELNPRVELYVPRFMSPVRIRTRSMFVPRTKFTFDFSHLNRINYFNVNSFKFVYGYKWKTNKTIDHDLNLLNITYFNIGNQSGDFLELIKVNPLLGRRFEKQLIAGISYSFFYNEQVLAEKQNPFYLNVNFESAGNAISGYKSLILNQTPSSVNPIKVGQVNYSQFLRLDVDLRQYFYLDKKKESSLVTRFIAGWGLPYGNSATMPYIKQFFSGGAYSVRGFPAFSLGPGTFAPPEDLRGLFFLQQGGEIKLELNAEYRFPIVSVMKGALFVDAGNTWLSNPNSDIPGGVFGNSFYKELAASYGFGLRADVQFFVLRLDLGIPFRKPWLPEGERYTFNQFNLSSSQWRRNNLVLNLAFGYPF